MENPPHRHLIQIVFAALGLLVSSCGTGPGATRIDNIPMYGQPAITRPEILRKADEAFIKEAVSGFGGSRELASKAWHAEGERFFRDRNLDYAMRRYNQAWLLNPRNYQPYWGFGRVLLQADRFSEAIEQFEMAKKLCDDTRQKVGLLSDTGVAYSYAGNFQLANQHFEESTALDPNYANAWLRWSESLYRQGDLSAASDKLMQARSLGAKIPDGFLQKLSQKNPTRN